jgi:hypothetical protein
MAENRGGYRKPNNPAPVSGPGKFSRRTDGGPMDNKQPQRYMQGDGYGQSKELNELQAGAPLAGAPSRLPSQGQPRKQMPMPTPFGAATERPDEPITAGAPVGQGPNELDLPTSQANVQDKQKLYVMLQILDRAASQPGASVATQNLVRRLRGIL